TMPNTTDVSLVPWPTLNMRATSRSGRLASGSVSCPQPAPRTRHIAAATRARSAPLTHAQEYRNGPRCIAQSRGDQGAWCGVHAPEFVRTGYGASGQPTAVIHGLPASGIVLGQSDEMGQAAVGKPNEARAARIVPSLHQLPVRVRTHEII